MATAELHTSTDHMSWHTTIVQHMETFTVFSGYYQLLLLLLSILPIGGHTQKARACTRC